MKDYIKNIVQKIVNKQFSSSMERHVVLHDDRLNFRCCYCHEGKTKNKKRGNIYFNKLMYICFRCGKTTNLDKFFRDFDEVIDPDKKLEIINHLDQVMTFSDYENDFIDAKFDNLIDLCDLEDVFNSDLTQITNFTPIKENGGVFKYLTGRGISPEMHKNIYQAKFWKNEDNYEWVIIMLNRRNDKILGMQVRNLKSGKNRMFKIYNYENLLEWINHHKNKIDIDISEMVVYNKLSYYFNILNVDFDKKITIFEGYLDSLFYPNSIGLVGVNTDYRFLENNGFELQYFFDNDEAGYKKSEEKIKDGFSVFLWKKLFENIVTKKNDNDPYRLLHRISKVKDINKLAELSNNPYSRFKLNNFFSSDVMDIKWIPRFKNRFKFNSIDDKNYNQKFDSLNH